MKVSKAIEELTNQHRDNCNRLMPIEKEALKLGIEALKRCRILAQESTLWKHKPLPGETPEEQGSAKLYGNSKLNPL